MKSQTIRHFFSTRILTQPFLATISCRPDYGKQQKNVSPSVPPFPAFSRHALRLLFSGDIDVQGLWTRSSYLCSPVVVITSQWGLSWPPCLKYSAPPPTPMCTHPHFLFPLAAFSPWHSSLRIQGFTKFSRLLCVSPLERRLHDRMNLCPFPSTFFTAFLLCLAHGRNTRNTSWINEWLGGSSGTYDFRIVNLYSLYIWKGLDVEELRIPFQSKLKLI